MRKWKRKRGTADANADQWTQQADELFGYYQQTGDLSALRNATRLFRRVQAATPPGHPGYAGYLSNLGLALRVLSGQTGDQAALAEAVQVGRDAVTATPLTHPDRAMFLRNLGLALDDLFEQTGDLDVLAEAVRAGRDAVTAAPPGHPDRATYLTDLGAALYVLFEQTGDQAALAEAVQAGRDALAAAPPGHPNLAKYVSNLGLALRVLFEQTGDQAALAEAVQAGRDAVAAIPPGHPDHAAVLSNLGIALQTLFRQTGDQAALAEAVPVSRDAVTAAPPGHPDRAGYLSNLGAAVRALFEQTGDQAALAEAVQAGRDAVTATSPGHPDRAKYLSNLGAALRVLFEQTGDQAALAEAVQAGRDAVAAAPPGHPDHAAVLANLGIALQTLFRRTWDQAALAEAVQAGRDAVTATPPGHPDRAGYLAELGLALQALFEQTGDQAALAEAVQAGRDAVAAAPPGHPDRVRYLSNLGGALQTLFRRTWDQAALAEAVQVGRDAVTATPPGHPDRAAYLSDLGLALQVQFEQTGDQAALAEAALAEAVQVGRDAVAATPPGHPDRAGYLSNLVGALRLLGRTGDQAALAEAVQVGRDALSATSTDHPDRAIFLNNLGRTLRNLFERTGDQAALAEARNVFAEAAAWVVAPVTVRVRSHRGLGWAEMSAGDGQAALAAYEDAIALLPQIAPRRMSRPDRQHGLGELHGLAAEAASAAIQAGLPERAVELLEQARGVLLAEAMDARGDLTELRIRAPGLAAEFLRLRDSLDSADHTTPDPGDRADLSPDRPTRPQTGDGTQGQVWADWAGLHETARRIANRHRALAQEWDSLLARIREVPGLEGFLVSPPIRALLRHAADGPIVMVNVSRYRCDALILTNDTVRPVRLVELPNLTHGTVIDQVNRLLAATSRSLADREREQREIRTVLGWLWDEITGPVLADLRFTGRPGPGQAWPRVWWCPVGETSFLPLHAAGYHNNPIETDADGYARAGAPRTVLDRVISSYTPTIGALGYARHDPADSFSVPGDRRDGALIVAMPHTPHASALPGTQAEAERITELLPGSLTLTGPEATHDAVLAALPQHRIAHLACHGLSDWNTPAASRLLLHDHATRPLTVTAVSRLRLGGGLAYLSACSTTGANQRLADEAVHITAAFQLAGYEHVIGTLWPINDAAAARVANDFYTYLTGDGTTPPRTGQAAHALHHAVRRLRDHYPASPSVWAAHIHAGI